MKKTLPDTTNLPTTTPLKASLSGEAPLPTQVVVKAAGRVMEQYRIVRFHGRAMIEITSIPYKGAAEFTHFTPLHKEHFETLAYPILGGLSRSRLSDVFSYVINTAPDLSYNDHLIAFGDWVWNTRTLDFEEMDRSMVVWRASVPVFPTPQRSQVVMDLAGGDAGAYDDMMQSMAPLLMETKPDGVIWWVGSGANGKSSLMEALYRIFPNQLASLTVKSLTDERDTLMLNGHLANVVKESSEGRIDDTQIYKSIGTHEDFRVHKFHSQESLVIRGNIHHIFSGNSIPTFNDKGYSARRRTHIIPFNQVFASDPSFNQRTFTTETLSILVGELMRYAIKLRHQGYLYKFSQVSTEAKVQYDAEANNAEEFAKELIAGGVVGFDSFEPLKIEYETWCAQNGYVPLGISNMRKAITSVGFDRLTMRTPTGETIKRYRLPTINAGDMIPYGLARPGIFTAIGFTPEVDPTPEPPKQQDLGKDW